MYDSTNIVPKPIVTGVTSLGLDHIHVLGKTLAEIGWQKGGIYKVRATEIVWTYCSSTCLDSQAFQHLQSSNCLKASHPWSSKPRTVAYDSSSHPIT